MENVRVLSLLENDEIVFPLAAMSQSEQGGECHIWDSAYADMVKFTASEV